jgi:hypothetical protein
MHPSIPKRGFSRANSTHRVSQRFIRAPRLAAVTRYRHRHQAARPPRAEGVLLPHAAFRATSSSLFFGSPTANLLCPDLDPSPASAASCSNASLSAPGSRPCHRTSPSIGEDVLRYAHFPRCVLRLAPCLQLFSAPIICASVCLLFDMPSSPCLRTNHTQLCGKQGRRSRNCFRQRVLLLP